MKRGMVIIDADGHVGDFESMYRKRLPEEFRQRQSIGAGGDGFDRRQNGRIPWRATSIQQNLDDNDLEGIDIQVLYPTGGLGYTRQRERDYCIAFARTYNDFVAEYCAANPTRLKGVAITPLHVDVKAAIEELDRAIGVLGLAGVMVHTYIRGRNVGDRDFWPFYEERNRQGVAVGFHASGGGAMDSVCHFDNLMAMHTFAHFPEQPIACASVIYGGLLEQFQDLQVAFLEAGCGWVPYFMERMDSHFEKRPFDAPLLKAKPSEYMTSGRVYVSCEPEERTLPVVADWLGEDNILFPSDYPHWDSAFPHAVDELVERTDVSDQLKRKIFFDNPRRFYRFEVDPADFAEPVRQVSRA